MFIKMFSAIALTGALWVAGDAAYKSFGDCCFPGSACCNPVSECCFSASNTNAKTDCCALDLECCQPAQNCCSAVKTAQTSCCSTPTATQVQWYYCVLTGEFYADCCETVNGEQRCTITGHRCEDCCIPVE